MLLENIIWIGLGIYFVFIFIKSGIVKDVFKK